MPYTKSCLLIDDDHDDQLVFSLAINSIDRSVKCVMADNGFAALHKLEQEPFFTPDIIFLDLNLPGMNGIDCLVRIKANPRLANIPIIIYSTSSRVEDHVKTKALGATAFITKPSHIVELKSKLSEFF
jgi:CheY-like chemotaxis protein